MAMELLAVALFLCLSGVSLWLFIRLWKAGRFVARLTYRARTDQLAKELKQLFAQGIDSTLLLKANGRGLDGVEIRFRESQDHYRNMAELVDQLEANLAAVKLSEVVQLVKALFQLQATFDLSLDAIRKPLSILEQRLIKAGPTLGRLIARIEIVAAGTRVDPRKMMPVTSGVNVRQPLGVVVLDGEGKVLEKARVICQ